MKKSFLTSRRIENLNDGIFAIVMTLLALDLKVPGIINENLLEELIGVWPRFFIFFVSFVMLGVYWIGQHNQFHHIRFVDRKFLWISIIFLMFITLLPFTTGIIANYSGQTSAISIYGLNLIIIGAVGYVRWSYATKNHRLVSHSIDVRLVEMQKKRVLFSPAVCLLAVLFSFSNAWISLVLYAAIPVYYVFPGEVDRFWERVSKPHKDR